MAALEPLYHLLDTPKNGISKHEIRLTEVMLFLTLTPAIHQAIKHSRRQEALTDTLIDKESTMIENNFVRNLIEDILSTEEYSLEGMAYHLNVPEDALSDILIGYNQSPSLALARRIMELHKCVRRELYQHLVKKITLHSPQNTLNDESW